LPASGVPSMGLAAGIFCQFSSSLVKDLLFFADVATAILFLHGDAVDHWPRLPSAHNGPVAVRSVPDVPVSLENCMAEICNKSERFLNPSSDVVSGGSLSANEKSKPKKVLQCVNYTRTWSDDETRTVPCLPCE